jgi:predicted nuclease of restriction endonuclease-like (RecB) superfamily
MDRLSTEYQELLISLKQRIRTSQIRAALAVNQELILLYWQIGREILLRQSQQGWGAKVIDRLSQDLRGEFPEIQGLSGRNLKYMRAFAEAYPENEFVQQLVAQIPWGHNLIPIIRVKDDNARLWDAQQMIWEIHRASTLTNVGFYKHQLRCFQVLGTTKI